MTIPPPLSPLAKSKRILLNAFSMSVSISARIIKQQLAN